MKHLRYTLLLFLLFIVFVSCNETLSSDSNTENSKEIETIISNARFDYKTKFQAFLEVHPFLDSPRWEDYKIIANNDSCTVITIPIDKKDSLNYDSKLDIIEQHGSLSYYLNMRPSIKRGSETINKNTVLLCKFRTKEMVIYEGYIENDEFKFKNDSQINLPFVQTLSRANNDCSTEKCHFEGYIDGGELPGVTVTPDPELPDWWQPDGGGWDDWGTPNYPGYKDWWENQYQYIPSTPNVEKRFPKGSQLGEKNTKTLDDEINKLRSNCIYETIDNYVTSKNFWKGEVLFDSNMAGNAALTSSGNLKFASADEITATNLSHEWIHAFQRLQDVDIFDKQYTGMAEFELALFQDITVYKTTGDLFRPEGNIPDNNSWVDNIRGTDVSNIRDEYQKWIMKIVRDDMVINHDEFLEWSKLFGKHAPGYSNMGYTYGNESYPMTINKLIEKVKGCLNS